MVHVKGATVFFMALCAAIPALAAPIVVRPTDAEFLAPQRRAAHPTDAGFLAPHNQRAPRPTDAQFLGTTEPPSRRAKPTDAQFLRPAGVGIRAL